MALSSGLILDTGHPSSFAAILSFPPPHHSNKGISLSLFSAPCQSFQWRCLVPVLLLCSLPCHLPTTQVSAFRQQLFSFSPEKALLPPLCSRTLDTAPTRAYHMAPDPFIFLCLSVSICKTANVTSFTGEVSPLTSSAGLEVVGISESWQKFGKLVGGDPVSWGCCAVYEGEQVSRAKALPTKKAPAKTKAGHSTWLQGKGGDEVSPKTRDHLRQARFHQVLPR